MNKIVKYALYYILISYIGNLVCLGLTRETGLIPSFYVQWETVLLSPITFPEMVFFTFTTTVIPYLY